MTAAAPKLIALALLALASCSEAPAAAPVIAVQGDPIDAPVPGARRVERRTPRPVREEPLEVAQAEPDAAGTTTPEESPLPEPETEPAAGPVPEPPIEPPVEAEPEAAPPTPAESAPPATAVDTAPPPAPAPKKAAADESEVLEISFDDLAYPEYVIVDDRDPGEEALPLSAFPEEIAELHGRTVGLDGYMIPIHFEDQRVKSFVLARDLAGCCFGAMLLPDEWVEVLIDDPAGVEYASFDLVRVTGRLEIGEVIDEYGVVTSLYRIVGDDIGTHH